MNATEAKELFYRQVSHLRRAWTHKVFSLRKRGEKVYCHVVGLESYNEGVRIVTHLRHLGFSSAHITSSSGGYTSEFNIRLNP
jgi:hypothetical protein